MTIYTYSKARQSLAQLLDEVKKEGKAIIKRRDGTLFSIQIETTNGSPLDVEGVTTEVTTSEMLGYIQKSRRSN